MDNVFQQMADAEKNPQQPQAQAPTQSTPAQPSAPQPTQESRNVFEVMKEREQSQPTATAQQSANDSNSEAAKELAHRQAVGKHGLLARAWDWVNQPIFDNILPRDIKTSDIVKAAAFEKMFGEAYIPGVNDFDTKAESHMGGAKGEKPTDSALKNAIRTFIAGSAKDTADMASSFTSPLSIGTLSLGEIGKGVGVIPKLARTVSPLVGTAFGLQGLWHGAKGGLDIYQHGATPENTQEALSGAGQALLAGGEGARDLNNRLSTLKEQVRPVTKTVAGQEVPVRTDTRAGRFASKLVEPEVLSKAAAKTAAAVQQGVGEVAKGATGSDADTVIKGEDRFGLRGHANDLIENQARPVFKALDELSDGEFSKAQRAEKLARRVGDFDKLNEAIERQDQLTEQFRNELDDKGLDVDEAWDNYRKGQAINRLATQFDTTTAAKDTGIGYQVKGDKLANAIDRIRRSAPEKNLFAKAGFTDSHVDALAELADTLRNEQDIPQFKAYQRFAARSIAGAIGFSHSGILGLAEALTGESAAESVARRGATSLLGKAMLSEPAARELNDAVKAGDTDKGVTAVENMAKDDPAWWEGLKSSLQSAWEKYKGSKFGSETGAVGMDINKPVKRLGGTSDDAPAPTFFSKAERVANDKVNSGSGDSILAALRNNGVKESEIQWLGLDDFLKGKQRVSKTDVQQFINDHKIALNEVNLGGDDWKNVRDLTVDRNKVHAENNRIWADHLRYADGSTDLFNAMKEGRDIEPVIAKMPADVQEPARRFVETDQQIRDLDSRINDAERRGNHPVKYESYTLPGDKDNYSEKLLTLADNDPKTAAMRDEYDRANSVRENYLQAGRPVPGDVELRFQDAQTAMRKAANVQRSFQSSHFEEPNILAHARYDDRTSLDGKRTLFLEELQSDWHQKGKKVGYDNPTPTTLPDGVYVTPDDDKFRVVNREGNPLLSRAFESEQEAKTAALTHYGVGAGNRGVPDAPFKSDWHELVIKRMLRHAAENGYDRLAWTTGDQQAARYDLSKHVDNIDWRKNADGTYSVTANKGGNEDGGTYQDPEELFRKDGVSPEELNEVVGKDAAEKIRQGRDVGTLSGVDLKVGGEWAKALYDRAIPNFLNKYAKKWGAKVGTTDIDTTPSNSLRYEIVDPHGDVQDAFRNKAGAKQAVHDYNAFHRGSGKWTVRDKGTSEKVHSIEITPEMKRSVLHEGQPIAENNVGDKATEQAA